MKNKRIKVCSILWVIVICILLTGCEKLETPSKEEIYTTFQEAYADIQIITNYLLSSECETIFYPASDGDVFADFERIPLDNSIKDAVYSLSKNHGVVRFSKRLDDNAIVFEMWTDQLERDCGVVYAINSSLVPDIQYLTILEQLTESGWYYYVADYNEWRLNN